MTNLLQAKGLHAAYGETRVLHGIDFAVRQGGVTALLGANGAGKTTTLRAICALVRTEGEITLDGTSIGQKATEDIVRLGVAHVPDGRGTFMELSVEENLKLGAYTRPGARGDGRFRKHFQLLPAAEGTLQTAGRHLVRRRAADAGDCPRPGAAPAPAAAG